MFGRNPFRRDTTKGGMGVPWRGRVTRVASPTVVYVEIPLYAKGKEFACEDYSTALIEGSSPGGAVTGNIKPLAVGDRVVVQFWGPDDPVVVSRKV